MTDKALLDDLYTWANAIKADAQTIIANIDAARTAPPIAPLPVYGQRDPRWANVKLGRSQTTIGQEGCLMTCAAQMLTELGNHLTPPELNAWLIENNGFIGGNRFVFGALDKFGLLKFRMVGNCVSTPAPMLVLDAVLNSGGFVIAQVDFAPGGSVQQHWVLYRGQGQITDPLHGDTAPITRYGKDAATAIVGYAIYDAVKG